MNYLRRMMDSRNLNGAEVARVSGVSTSQISDILLGRKSPTVRTLQKVADSLGFSIVVVDKKKSENRKVAQ